MGYEAHYHNGVLLIRKSMIEDYTFCPYRFKKVWIDDVQRVPNQVMLIGTRFHDFAKKFFDYCGTYPPEYWDRFIPKEFIQVEKEMAQWFINYERDRLKTLTSEGRELQWRPIMREHNMKSTKLFLEGTCDRIDWFDRDKEEVIIVEYKTGRSTNDVAFIRQLAFYSMLWQDTAQMGDVAGLRLVNPRLQIVKDYKIDRWQTDRVLKDVMAVRDSMKKKDFKPKCSLIKLAMCKMCTPEESGCAKPLEGDFEDYVDWDEDFEFGSIYNY